MSQALSAQLAALSNNLVYAAMAAYTVALLALAAQLAATRTVPGEAPRPVREPVSVSVGSSRRDGGSSPKVLDPAPALPAASSRAERLARIGRSVLVLATLLLAGGVVARGLAAGRTPWGNMYEFSITGALVAALAYLLLRRRYPLDAVGVWLVAVVLLTLGLAVTVLYVPVGPLLPALRSYWLVIHVFAAIVSAGVFTVAMVLSALQIVAERAERTGRPLRGYLATLPAAGRLDALAYRVTAFGFPVWSFAVVAGAIWAEVSWGRYWGWDPKEVWALVTWLVYAAYLHARTTAGWRGRRASVVALVGYATLLFNFFGVNLFFAGLHAYGGV